MAAINELYSSNTSAEVQQIRKTIAEFFWSWFEQNKDDTLFIKRRVLGFLTIEVKIKDARFLFERLFGPQPSSIL